MRYQSKCPKRQFLAGVTCPKCHAMDVVVQVQIFDPEDEYIECTICGYTEHRPSRDDVAAMQLKKADNDVSVVRFK